MGQTDTNLRIKIKVNFKFEKKAMCNYKTKHIALDFLYVRIFEYKIRNFKYVKNKILLVQTFDLVVMTLEVNAVYFSKHGNRNCLRKPLY